MSKAINRVELREHNRLFVDGIVTDNSVIYTTLDDGSTTNQISLVIPIPLSLDVASHVITQVIKSTNVRIQQSKHLDEYLQMAPAIYTLFDTTVIDPVSYRPGILVDELLADKRHDVICIELAKHPTGEIEFSLFRFNAVLTQVERWDSTVQSWVAHTRTNDVYDVITTYGQGHALITLSTTYTFTANVYWSGSWINTGSLSYPYNLEVSGSEASYEYYLTSTLLNKPATPSPSPSISLDINKLYISDDDKMILQVPIIPGNYHAHNDTYHLRPVKPNAFIVIDISTLSATDKTLVATLTDTPFKVLLGPVKPLDNASYAIRVDSFQTDKPWYTPGTVSPIDTSLVVHLYLNTTQHALAVAGTLLPGYLPVLPNQEGAATYSQGATYRSGYPSIPEVERYGDRYDITSVTDWQLTARDFTGLTPYTNMRFSTLLSGLHANNESENIYLGYMGSSSLMMGLSATSNALSSITGLAPTLAPYVFLDLGNLGDNKIPVIYSEKYTTVQQSINIVMAAGVSLSLTDNKVITIDITKSNTDSIVKVYANNDLLGSVTIPVQPASGSIILMAKGNTTGTSLPDTLHGYIGPIKYNQPTFVDYLAYGKDAKPTLLPAVVLSTLPAITRPLSIIVSGSTIVFPYPTSEDPLALTTLGSIENASAAVIALFSDPKGKYYIVSDTGTGLLPSDSDVVVVTQAPTRTDTTTQATLKIGNTHTFHSVVTILNKGDVYPTLYDQNTHTGSAILSNPPITYGGVSVTDTGLVLNNTTSIPYGSGGIYNFSLPYSNSTDYNLTFKRGVSGDKGVDIQANHLAVIFSPYSGTTPITHDNGEYTTLYPCPYLKQIKLLLSKEVSVSPVVMECINGIWVVGGGVSIVNGNLPSLQGTAVWTVNASNHNGMTALKILQDSVVVYSYTSTVIPYTTSGSVVFESRVEDKVGSETLTDIALVASEVSTVTPFVLPNTANRTTQTVVSKEVATTVFTPSISTLRSIVDIYATIVEGSANVTVHVTPGDVTNVSTILKRTVTPQYPLYLPSVMVSGNEKVVISGTEAINVRTAATEHFK